MMKLLALIAVTLEVGAFIADSFSLDSSSALSRRLRGTLTQTPRGRTFMSLNGAAEINNDDIADTSNIADTTTLGNLQVPSVGIGTISWSSENCKPLVLIPPDCRRAKYIHTLSLFPILQLYSLKIWSCSPWSIQPANLTRPSLIQLNATALTSKLQLEWDGVKQRA